MKYIGIMLLSSMLTVWGCKKAYNNGIVDCGQEVYIDPVFRSYREYKCKDYDCDIRTAESEIYRCIKKHWLFK